MENRTKALLIALLLAPLQVHADPISLVAALAPIIGGTAAAFVVTYVAAAGLALNMTARAKRKARAAAARQRAEYNASLSDRMTTVISADAPQKVAYGRTYVGGTVVAMFTTDRPQPPKGTRTDVGMFTRSFELEGKNKDALRHLVVVLTSHECEAVGEIKIDGVEVGPLDAQGYPTGGEFFKAQTVYRSKTFTVPANGQLNLDLVPLSVVSVSTRTFGDRAQYVFNSQPFTASGSVVQVATALQGQTVFVYFKLSYPLSPVRIQKHRGYPGEPADAYLMGLLPDKWTADHRLAGYAYLVVTLDLNERRFQGGPPSILAEVLGKKVFDPRTGLTQWSDNPALCLADYLQSPMWSGNTRVSVIQSDLIAAANVCDEQIGNRTGITRTASDFLDAWKVAGFGFISQALGSSKIKRYTCNGAFSSADDPEAVLDDLKESMAGDAFVAGGWRIIAGSWTTPVATLDISAADGQVEVPQVGASWNSVVNSVRGNFVPAGESAPKDFEVYVNEALVTSDGQRLWDDVSLPFTNQGYRCANLVRIRVEKSRNGLVLRWPAPAEAWALQPGDRVWVKYPTLLGDQPKTFRVTEWSFGLQTPVYLTLEEDAAAVWDLVDQTVVDQTPNTTLPNPYYVPPVVGFTASSGAVDDLQRLADGTVIPTVKVSWGGGGELPSGAALVIQYRLVITSEEEPVFTHRVPADQSQTRLTNVREGDLLLIRARYETSVAEGEWVDVTHLVLGKSVPPSTVATADVSIREDYLNLSWSAVPDIDVSTYEVRLSDSGWGTDGHVFRGSALACPVEPAASGVARTWFVRALDSSGNYSTASRQASYTLPQVANPAAASYSYADTSLTSAEILLEWSTVSHPIEITRYEVSYGSATVNAATNRLTLPANWVGLRNFTIRAVDRAGNKSSGLVLAAEKQVPASVSGLRAQVIDNVVMLYWTLPPKTSLPLAHVKIRRGESWATATDIGTKDGEFTTITELSGGLFTYWVAVVDTDDNESVPVSVVANVSQPPDFRFNGQFVSDFSGTLVNAVRDGAGVLLPVNQTETFAQHFVNNSWTSPAAQIAAGFPYYTQPGTSSGYYEQVYDYGSTLGSSNVSVEIEGTKLAGNPDVVTTLSFSNGGAYTDYPGSQSVFATAFRYVKVRVTVNQTAAGGLYKLGALRLVLQSKQKNDSGSASVGDATAAPNGTVVNFNSEFVDIEAITPVGMGTTPVTAVPEFRDELLYGTYTVTSGVATVNITGHNLVVGQNVRLDFSSGLGIRGVYPVASVVSANSFTVAMGASNTSGNVTAYWAGFRVRLFNTSGTRVSGTISWSARGY